MSNTTRFYRYYRQYDVFLDHQDSYYTLSKGNLGGITFDIEIDQDLGSLSYGVAIAYGDDNFEKAVGRKMVTARFENEETRIHVEKYDRSKPAIDNILIDLMAKQETGMLNDLTRTLLREWGCILSENSKRFNAFSQLVEYDERTA